MAYLPDQIRMLVNPHRLTEKVHPGVWPLRAENGSIFMSPLMEIAANWMTARQPVISQAIPTGFSFLRRNSTFELEG